jgi:hypothetical protein
LDFESSRQRALATGRARLPMMGSINRTLYFVHTPQPRRPGAASRTTREDFQMAVGFVFLVLHKESNFFLRFLF